MEYIYSIIKQGYFNGIFDTKEVVHMQMRYEEALLSPNISWDSLTQGVKIPKQLYKYQGFYKCDDTDNPYWEENIKGSFHMSLGCEFEDTNDCKPFINKQFIKDYINEFFTSMLVDKYQRERILLQLDKDITEEGIKKIELNYQSQIRIGCFTLRSDNDKMWDKYADIKKGYCIEYNTSKNKLFELSTLPVLYSNNTYNNSLIFANMLILESNRRAKQRTDKEDLEVCQSVYSKIIKTTYIPVFIKQKETWGFEEEYRLFLLKYRNTRDGMIKMEDFLDINFNINLSDAISAIYLGEHFDTNKNSDQLLKKIIGASKEKNILVFRKIRVDGKLKDMKVE